MNQMTNQTTRRPAHESGYELCFDSLFQLGRGYRFPCDDQGAVDLNTLGEKRRVNYLFARAVVGRDLARPEVRRCCAA